ncbi:hypothetical protein N7486_003420 [Penicillium sp. IBT 16267x]|nr:hypothetical protein N7486_003420 [Penicillium sp. IBT 16267x]
MEIHVDLQPQRLLVHPTSLAKHLQSMLKSDTSRDYLNSINTQILHQTHTEAVTCSVYQVWLYLSWRYSPHLLLAALRDQTSAGVRKAGIKVVRHIFGRPSQQVRGWSLLGGAQGIKAILDGLPLAEVRLFVKAISRSGHDSDSELLATYFDELVALIDASDTWTTRSFSRYVAPLYAHCSARKVTEILRSGISCSSAFSRHLGRTHPYLLRQIAIGEVEVPLPVRRYILETCAEILLQSNKPYGRVHATEIYAGNLAGVTFGVDLLSQLRANEPELRTRGPLIRQWTGLILNLAIRRKLPFDVILPILNFSLEMCRFADSSNWLSQNLPKEVLRCWSVARFRKLGDIEPFHAAMKNARALSPSWPGATSQAALEECLIEQVLSIRDQRFAVQVTLAELSAHLALLLSYVHSDGRLELLQLLCKHSPTINFDLTIWPPSEEERKIFPVWSYPILCRLSKSDSKSLFHRSLQNQNSDTFIPEDLVKRNSWALDWESQCSLWAGWECSTAKGTDDFPVTYKALAEMKQRATRGREPDERLRWAHAAIRLATETKCLDIFCDLVDWSKRFLRDQKVFPPILTAILSRAGKVLSCGADTRPAKIASESNLQAEIHRANLTLKGLLESILLLLREPWALNMRSMTFAVGRMFSDILRQRMDAVKSYTLDRLATESKLVEILLHSLLPIIIEYERQGNLEDHTALSWSGPSGLIRNFWCPDRPSMVELAFMDRLGKARDDLWADLRARSNPDVLTLGPGWPRGLPLQHLAPDKAWLYHALRIPEAAPFLSSRSHEFLFSSRDIIVASLPQDFEPIDGFMEDLGFAVHATISRGEQTEKENWVRRIWEHYSSALQTHPLQLELFQEWLVQTLQNTYTDKFNTAEAIKIIQPSITAPIPSISNVPTGSDVAEWDPQEDFEDAVEACKPLIDAKRPKLIPCIILNSRMHCNRRFVDGFVRTRDIKSRPGPNPIAIWLEDLLSTAASKNHTFDNREAVILSALLFLDSSTPHSRLLQAKFPDSEYPRYGPTFLADEFITRVTKVGSEDSMNKALGALMRNTKHVPAQILQDLICSLLDTLKTSPHASNYPILLHCTLGLIEILLNSSQPQLVLEVALRLWKGFPNDSSSHRKVSLVKIGRCLTPDQASGMIQSLVAYAGDSVQKTQAPGDSPENPVMKVTTVKMLAQNLTSADFLAPATRVHLLESLFNARNHLDIRVEIVKSLLKLVSQDNSSRLFKILSTISLSTAGPSERDTATDDDWRTAEAGGALPSILSQRPVLDLLVNDAVREIPKELHSDYVQNVLLPLVTESIRQHTRWMTLFLARLSLSLSDLGLTDSDIGPFCFSLVDSVFKNWICHVPATYLQFCRSRDFVYLHRDAFNRIAEALELSTDPIIKNDNVRGHFHALLESQRHQRPFGYADRFFFVIDTKEPKAIPNEVFLEDYMSRIEVFSRSPVVYKSSLRQYNIHPGYTLEVLKQLRQAGRPFGRQTFVRKLMIGIVDAAERVRKEGWSPGLTAHPVTVSAALEYAVQLLPWPSCKPEPSSSDLHDFVSGVMDLISNYVADPVLVIKIDAFAPILEDVRKEDKVACALLLGENLGDRNDQHGLVKGWVKVRLAMMLLKAAKKAKVPLDGKALEMIERWKGSDIEMVRQTAWEWDWST